LLLGEKKRKKQKTLSLRQQANGVRNRTKKKTTATKKPPKKMNPRFWGGSAWSWLMYYGRHSRAPIKAWAEMLAALQPLLPCAVCSRSACDYWCEHPLQEQKEVFRALFDLREDINRRKKRPPFLFEKAWQQFEDTAEVANRAHRGLFCFLWFIASMYPDCCSPFCKIKPADCRPQAIFERFLSPLFTILRNTDVESQKLAETLNKELADKRAWQDSSSLLASLALAEQTFSGRRMTNKDVEVKLARCVRAMTKKTRRRIGRRVFLSTGHLSDAS
jgi:hypothetical protein